MESKTSNVVRALALAILVALTGQGGRFQAPRNDDRGATAVRS